MYGILNGETGWNKLQVKFLEQHTSFTASAKMLRKAGKEEFIAQVRQNLDKGQEA